MQCIFIGIRRLQQGCRPAYFENEKYNYSERLYTSKTMNWSVVHNGFLWKYCLSHVHRAFTINGRMDGK